MIDNGAAFRLLLDLIVAAYGIVALVSRDDRPANVPLLLAGVGAVPLFVWSVFPGLFAAGSVASPLFVNRAGLGIGAAAVVVRYLSARAHRDEKGEPAGGLVADAWRYVGLVLLLVSVALVTTNWMVVVAMGVSVAAAIVNLAAASRRGSSAPRSRSEDC